jgi:AhpD family alkylhydroperoxidase
MEARLSYANAAPQGYRAVVALNSYVDDCGLDPILLELVKLRASQINGCAYCLDMHSKDLRALGEREERIYALSAWHETPFYTERERAALLWAEALTLVNEDHVPDEIYEEARRHFNEEALVNLTLAIATVGVWNRLCIAFRSVPGAYASSRTPLATAAD